uniref:Neur_chan_LBD domain-containing protein n=1 Tax=Soboliphyme baturini TaxID=241478 RepID=A0A183J2F3_9BILA
LSDLFGVRILRSCNIARSSSVVIDTNDDVGNSILYYPARDRLSPHYLEMSFTIPAFSQCDLSIEFDKAMLRWTEYPPDAHHGFHVPAPMVTQKSTVQSLILLVTLPTPDFSMPYNVICLVCTVVALAFGPIHNLTTKRMHATALWNLVTLNT